MKNTYRLAIEATIRLYSGFARKIRARRKKRRHIQRLYFRQAPIFRDLLVREELRSLLKLNGTFTQAAVQALWLIGWPPEPYANCKSSRRLAVEAAIRL